MIKFLNATCKEVSTTMHTNLAKKFSNNKTYWGEFSIGIDSQFLNLTLNDFLNPPEPFDLIIPHNICYFNLILKNHMVA